jgi:hypothetical protein
MRSGHDAKQAHISPKAVFPLYPFAFDWPLWQEDRVKMQKPSFSFTCSLYSWFNRA